MNGEPEHDPEDRGYCCNSADYYNDKKRKKKNTLYMNRNTYCYVYCFVFSLFLSWPLLYAFVLLF